MDGSVQPVCTVRLVHILWRASKAGSPTFHGGGASILSVNHEVPGAKEKSLVPCGWFCTTYLYSQVSPYCRVPARRGL